MENRRQQFDSSLTFALLMHREELQRRNKEFLKLSKSKITLTDYLISRSVKYLDQYSWDELAVVNREMLFRKKLKSEFKRMRMLREFGMSNVQPNVSSTEL